VDRVDRIALCIQLVGVRLVLLLTFI
jgi:hypothetical protein